MRLAMLVMGGYLGAVAYLIPAYVDGSMAGLAQTVDRAVADSGGREVKMVRKTSRAPALALLACWSALGCAGGDPAMPGLAPPPDYVRTRGESGAVAADDGPPAELDALTIDDLLAVDLGPADVEPDASPLICASPGGELRPTCAELGAIHGGGDGTRPAVECAPAVSPVGVSTACTRHPGWAGVPIRQRCASEGGWFVHDCAECYVCGDRGSL